MKKFKKVSALILAGALALSMGACNGVGGGGGAANNPDTIQFYFWQSGFGSKYMKKMVEDFNKKQDKYTVEFEYTAAQSSITSTLNAGSANTYDLYLTPCPANFEDIFENLDDVLDTTVEGESISIRQKMGEERLGTLKRADGKVYHLNYGDSLSGLFYNSSIIDGSKYKVPRTTNELEELVFALTGDGLKPFVHFSDSANGYYEYVYEVWHAQYDGLDYYRNKFMTLAGDDGQTPSKARLEEKDGRWETLKVLESILTPDTVTDASNEQEFTVAQTSLFNGDAVMMVNGTWVKNEMESMIVDDSLQGVSANDDIILMKTPVISAIVNKLEKKITDKQLSAIVEQIDLSKTYEETKTATGLTELSENDYKRIREARNLQHNGIGGQKLFIPNYSNAKAGAKEFIKYMFSDEGLLTWCNELHLAPGATLNDPTKLDLTTWTEWDMYHYNLAEQFENTLLVSANISPIFNKYGMDSFVNQEFISAFTAKNPKDQKSSDVIWSAILQRIDQQWQYWEV
ncbi:MAG: extracellular solute-binding protein [Clostridia bacterium]|nr:extracellular solute-binding protein [Clostridia bacterium]